MNVKYKKRILSALPAAAVMVIIFLFSAQHAEQSSAGSDYIVEVLLQCTGNDTVQSMQYMSLLTFIIRKLAHTIEYAVLGLCLSYFYHQFQMRKRTYFLSVFLTGFLYACSDELHQYFVPGRSCEFRDVLIDSNGVLLGFLLAVVIHRIYRKKKRNS